MEDAGLFKNMTMQELFDDMGVYFHGSLLCPKLGKIPEKEMGIAKMKMKIRIKKSTKNM